MALNKLLACASSARATDMLAAPVIATARTNAHRFARSVKRPQRWRGSRVVLSFLGCPVIRIFRSVTVVPLKMYRNGLSNYRRFEDSRTAMPPASRLLRRDELRWRLAKPEAW
jgi:hypothetical protein